MHYLKVPGFDGRNILTPNLIIRIEGLSNYSKLYLLGEKPLVVSRVLRWFEDQLPPSMFTRVHRSHLVNRNFICQVQHEQQPQLLLSNGDVIAVSRRKRSQVMYWNKPLMLPNAC